MTSHTVAIHQPHYLPWLPYLGKALQADTFVLLDDVQYQRRGVQNRNQILADGKPQWLTVPVHGDYTAHIREYAITQEPWQRKHIQTLRQNYPQAHARPIIAEFEELILQPYDSLAALNAACTVWLFQHFSIPVRVESASSLNCGGQKEEKIIELCMTLGATRYLSGVGASAYQVPSHFQERGIELEYARYSPPQYPQRGARGEFVPDLSSLDLLLNHPADAPSILRSGLLPPSPAAEVHGT